MLSLPQSSSRPTTIDDDDLSFCNNPDESLASKFHGLQFYPPENLSTYSLDPSANINIPPISNPTSSHSNDLLSNPSHIPNSINGYSTSSHSNTLHQQLEKTIQQSWQHQLSKSRNLTDVLHVDLFAESISHSNETPIEPIILKITKNKKNKNNKKHKNHKSKHRQHKSKTKTNTTISKLSPLPQLTPTDTELFGGPKPYFIKRKPTYNNTYNNPFSPKAVAKHNKKLQERNWNCEQSMPVWHKSKNKSDINKKYKNKSMSVQVRRKHKKRKYKTSNRKPDVFRYKSTPYYDSNYHIVNDGDSVSQHEHFSTDDTVLF